MPRTNEMNIRMKNSNTLVTPTRSEIRNSVFAVVTSIAALFTKFYKKNVFAITFVMSLFLAVAYFVGAQLPWYVAAFAVIVAICGFLRGFLMMIVDLGKAERSRA